MAVDLSKTFPNKDGFGLTDTLISIENIHRNGRDETFKRRRVRRCLIGDAGANVINNLGGPDYIDGGPTRTV